MKTEELKTGFWGYQKFSVCQYITSLEEQFSAKLLEKDEESRMLLDKERQRVRQLEEELAELRQKYEAQCNQQQLISSTLVQAQRYAETLKAESEAQQQQAQQRLEEELAQRDQELERYSARLNQLRELFQVVLREMDASTDQLSDALDEARAEAPGNMTLFCRKPELVV